MPSPMASNREVVLACRDDDGVIEVIDEAGKMRSLQFGTEARQSTMFVSNPDALALAYTQCLMTSLLFVAPPFPESALVLGLGGGSLPKFLLRQCPRCRVDAVEKRARIIDVARAHFALPEDPRLRLHLSDGLAFLNESESARYDLILLDLHDSDGMAPAVRRPEFFPACRKSLRPQGLLAANLWYGHREGEEREVRKLMELNFGNRVLYLPVAGKRNCVALAFAQSPTIDIGLAQERARAWQSKTGIDFPDLLAQIFRMNANSELLPT